MFWLRCIEGFSESEGLGPFLELLIRFRFTMHFVYSRAWMGNICTWSNILLFFPDPKKT